jgi:hypothetical protein
MVKHGFLQTIRSIGLEKAVGWRKSISRALDLTTYI